MKDLAEYILVLAKLQNEEEALKLIEGKLKELVNAELHECQKIAMTPAKEWGEVCISTNRICKQILDAMMARELK